MYKAQPDVTHFTAGLGTTGTFTGTGKRLKELNDSIRLIALQPDFALHGLEGWKHLETAVVPEIYDDTVAHSIAEVSTDAAYAIIKIDSGQRRTATEPFLLRLIWPER
jgi:cysteine synthase B